MEQGCCRKLKDQLISYLGNGYLLLSFNAKSVLKSQFKLAADINGRVNMGLQKKQYFRKLKYHYLGLRFFWR